MYNVLADVIKLLHFFLVVFVIIVPFTPKLKWHVYVIHFATIATLLIHWYFYSDSCFLTLVESKLRGIPVQESFIHNIVSPIYKIQDSDLSNIIYLVTPILGVVSFIRIVKSFPEMKHEVKFIYNNAFL